MPRQTFLVPTITGDTVDDLRHSTSQALQLLMDRLDQLAGTRGTPTWYADVQANEHRIHRLGVPMRPDDAQRVDCCLHRETPIGPYDAGGENILNVKEAVDGAQAVNLEQVQRLLGEVGAALLHEPFVTAAASGTLLAERVLTQEAGVTTVADAGANSTITVGIATNGVSDAKLRQGAATSVIGRSANSVGNVADIAASADGQVLTRVGGALGFSLLVTSGTYTPALTNAVNVGASTAYECQWLRVGSVVTVSGKVDVDPAVAGATQLGIALPVASTLGAEEDCAGCACCPTIAGQSAAIRGDAANARAAMVWVAVDTTNQPMFFTFSYTVL